MPYLQDRHVFKFGLLIKGKSYSYIIQKISAYLYARFHTQNRVPNSLPDLELLPNNVLFLLISDYNFAFAKANYYKPSVSIT
jgi:hypothetical protein